MAQKLDLDEVSQALRLFAQQRDWEKFHSPKNLSMALSVEVSELVEHFQWLSEKQSFVLSANKLNAVEMELADILIYLVRIADILDVDLAKVIQLKMIINEEKYPKDKVYGSAKKYNDYE